MSLGKRITGTWRVLGDQLCERRGAETCFDVDKDGEKVTLTQDGTDITTTGYLRQLGRLPRGTVHSATPDTTGAWPDSFLVTWWF